MTAHNRRELVYSGFSQNWVSLNLSDKPNEKEENKNPQQRVPTIELSSG